jgi:hypothetical protein
MVNPPGLIWGMYDGWASKSFTWIESIALRGRTRTHCLSPCASVMIGTGPVLPSARSRHLCTLTASGRARQPYHLFPRRRNIAPGRQGLHWKHPAVGRRGPAIFVASRVPFWMMPAETHQMEMNWCPRPRLSTVGSSVQLQLAQQGCCRLLSVISSAEKDICLYELFVKAAVRA